MHVKTISTSVSTAITLGAGSYGDKLTITPTGAVVLPTYSGAAAITAPATLPLAHLLNLGGILAGSGAYGFTGNGGPGGVGVDLAASGKLTNHGDIFGGAGGESYYHNGGPGGAGVALGPTGTVLNAGDIKGGHGGYVDLGYGGNGGAGAVVNGGTLVTSGGIVGGNGGSGRMQTEGELGGVGVSLQQGEVINSGSIFGGTGRYGGAGVLINGGTLVTSGTIVGGAVGRDDDSNTPSAGDAVQFGPAVGTLVVNPGAVFNGDIAADPAVNDTLEVAGKANGTLSGLGSTVTGFTTITEDASAHWTFSGSISGKGTLDIGTKAQLTLHGTVSIASIAFAAPGASTLTLETAKAVTSIFSGFGPGDIIDLPTIQANALTFQQNTLTLLNSNNQVVDTLLFANGLTQQDFGLAAAGTGTEILYAGPDVPWTSASINGGISTLDHPMPEALLHLGAPPSGTD
jgi:hypothetical protein